jgi:hypothetical protein
MLLPSRWPLPRRGGISGMETFAAAAIRLFAALLGLSAIAWGMAVFPTLWAQLPVEHTAAAVLNRAAFAPHALLALVPALDDIEQASYCRPRALRSAAIIRLRLAENAVAGGERLVLDDRLNALEHSIHQALACEPTDSFLWAALAWLDVVRRGRQPQQLTYLRLSYQLGPNEGWVATRRSRVALSMFRRLPPDLADTVVREFAHMVNSWIYWDAIAIFTGPGWPVHDRLLAGLKDVGQRQREAFYSELYTEGYDIVVPGVKPRDPRPWY